MNSKEAPEYLKYGSNGKIEKGTPEYEEWRINNNQAISKCRESKKEIPKLEKELEEIEKEEEKVLKEAERLKQELHQYEGTYFIK